MAIHAQPTIKNHLTSDLVQRISSLIGESPSTIEKAIHGITPTLLARVSELSVSPDKANQLMNMINQQGTRRSLLTGLSGRLSGESASQSLRRSGRDVLKSPRAFYHNAPLLNEVGKKKPSFLSALWPALVLLALALPAVFWVTARCVINRSQASNKSWERREPVTRRGRSSLHITPFLFRNRSRHRF